ncbi:MAG: hypothetical protein N2V78_08930 [Methanophagales archaeon]|nr:hypothetical protein [Methanophagales archaeon]
MSVSIEEIKELLTDVALSDDAIEKIINDAENEIAGHTDKRGMKFDTAVRRYAAYIAFISSDLYESVKVADITVRKNLQLRAKNLYDLAMLAIKDLETPTGTEPVSTYMFDSNRPDIEAGEDWYG